MGVFQPWKAFSRMLLEPPSGKRNNLFLTCLRRPFHHQTWMRTWGSLIDKPIFAEQESGTPAGAGGASNPSSECVPPTSCSFHHFRCLHLRHLPPCWAEDTVSLLHGYSVSLHLCYWISYFAAAVMKHWGQGNFSKEEFVWTDLSRASCHGEKHGSRP